MTDDIVARNFDAPAFNVARRGRLALLAQADAASHETMSEFVFSLLEVGPSGHRHSLMNDFMARARL